MNIDERQEIIAQGERAAAILPFLVAHLEDINKSIVDRLVRLYNGGQLSPEAALAGWAEVKVLREIEQRLGRDVQRAAAARRERMNGREEPTDD